MEHTGEYEAIVRPQRLVFTFCVPKYAKESTRVTIDITPQIDGCELTLLHEGVWADYEERTKKGWIAILDGLASVLQTAAMPA